jgi:hypothetical protein
MAQYTNLTEVKRQQNGSYILDTATELRNSMIEKAIMPAIKAPKLHNVFHAVPDYVCDLQQYGPNQVVAIAATHKQNKLFNTQVRTLTIWQYYPKSITWRRTDR